MILKLAGANTAAGGGEIWYDQIGKEYPSEAKAIHVMMRPMFGRD